MPVPSVEARAKEAHEKKALYGTDVDLESYESEAKPHEKVQDAEELPSVFISPVISPFLPSASTRIASSASTLAARP